MNRDLKPYLREFSAFSQMGLYKFLLEKRKETTNKQVDALIQAGISSADPRVRAIAMAIVKDGAIWGLFAELADSLAERNEAPDKVVPVKQIRDYEVPEFASDFMPAYTP